MKDSFVFSKENLKLVFRSIDIVHVSGMINFEIPKFGNKRYPKLQAAVLTQTSKHT